MNITPRADFADDECRTAGLHSITADDITRRLGFPANRDDDPDKVSHSWGFEADGKFCAVWSYKGSEQRGHFSAFGPMAALAAIFGNNVSQ